MRDECNEPVDEWFELTRANYLVLPRLVLQSAPVEWQRRFVECLEELHEMFGDVPKQGQYTVYLRREDGRFFKDDPLADYRHGRPLTPTVAV
jgi:hypothetical protein